jgi:hypothetical protein
LTIGCIRLQLTPNGIPAISGSVINLASLIYESFNDASTDRGNIQKKRINNPKSRPGTPLTFQLPDLENDHCISFFSC